MFNHRQHSQNHFTSTQLRSAARIARLYFDPCYLLTKHWPALLSRYLTVHKPILFSACLPICSSYTTCSASVTCWSILLSHSRVSVCVCIGVLSTLAGLAMHEPLSLNSLRCYRGLLSRILSVIKYSYAIIAAFFFLFVNVVIPMMFPDFLERFVIRMNWNLKCFALINLLPLCTRRVLLAISTLNVTSGSRFFLCIRGTFKDAKMQRMHVICYSRNCIKISNQHLRFECFDFSKDSRFRNRLKPNALY